MWGTDTPSLGSRLWMMPLSSNSWLFCSRHNAMARHKSRSLEIWQLGHSMENAANRCVQMILFRSWMTCSCWEEVTTNIVKCWSFLHTFYWICPWMSVSYLVIWYHCPVLTAFSPEMMTCILKAHYINLTSTQMRQLLGVYQFAELREEALVTTFFRIIVPFS